MNTRQLAFAALILSNSVLISSCSGEQLSEPTAIPTVKATNTLTLSSTPLPAPTLTSTITIVPPESGMSLIFNDEFEGNKLDTNKWNTCYFWEYHGCTNSGLKEEQWYIPEGILVEDGLLRLQAIPSKDPIDGLDENGLYKPYFYTSGMVTSRDKFDATYGYFEIRAKLPKGKGLAPAFWLPPREKKELHPKFVPEIDIMEVLGDNPQILYATLHYENRPSMTPDKAEYTGVDLSSDFHIYAVDWTPNYIAWYLDGREYYRLLAHVPAEPLYIIANLAVGGNWPGSPNSKTQFPAYFDIDYIRVFRDLNLPMPTSLPITPETPAPSGPFGKLIYEEDFEDGTANELHLAQSKWQVFEDVDKNKVLNISKRNDWSYIRFKDLTLSDGTVEYRVKINEDSSNNDNSVLSLGFREGADQGYVFGMDFKNNTGVLAYADPNGWNMLNNGWAEINWQKGIWYQLRVEFLGEHINVYLNDDLIEGAIDSRLKDGTLNFGIGLNISAKFDDIRIWNKEP